MKMKSKHVRRRDRQQAGISRSLGSRLADVIDSAIWFISPRWSMQRRAARKATAVFEAELERLGDRPRNSSYDAARHDRNRDGWVDTYNSPDSALELDQHELHARADELLQNNEIYRSCIESRVSNEIGTGIIPQPTVMPSDSISDDEAEEINKAIKQHLNRWSRGGVDKHRRHSLAQMQRVANRSFANYGEVFALLSDKPTTTGTVPLVVDIINPMRVMTPPGEQGNPLVRMGIKYDRRDNILGYYVRTTHPDERGIYYQYKWDYYPRLDASGQPRMLHVYDEVFPGQTRGIPWLTAAFNRIKDLEDFWEAELIAKKMEACFGLIISVNKDSPVTPHDVANAAAGNDEQDGRKIEDIYPGMIEYLKDGEEVKGIDPERPGSNFSPFVEATLRSIAGAANYPYELIAKNFFRTTFSSGQLAMLDGRLGFKMRTNVLIEQLLDPVYDRFVYELVFLNEIDGLVDALEYRDSGHVFNRHGWQMQGHGFLNPRDEIRAASQALEDDITTLTDLYDAQGQDVREALERRKQEKLQQVRDDVEVRTLQWELEEQEGLPHREEDDSESSSSDDDSSSQAEQDAAEEAAA